MLKQQFAFAVVTWNDKNRLSANTKRVVVIGGRNPLVGTYWIISLLCTNRFVRKCFSHLVETLNLSSIVGIFQWHQLVENHNYQSQICKEGLKLPLVCINCLILQSRKFQQSSVVEGQEKSLTMVFLTRSLWTASQYS